MPMIRVDLVRGRDRAMLTELLGELTATAARVLNTPADRIRVVINEVDPQLWGIGGVPYSQVRGAPASPAQEEPASAPEPATAAEPAGSGPP